MTSSPCSLLQPEIIITVLKWEKPCVMSKALKGAN